MTQLRSFLLCLLLATIAAGAASAGVFDQSDWSFHPTEPDWARAYHPADQSGWRRYFSAPSEVEAGASVTLRRLSVPWLVDTAADFQAGTLSGLVIADPTVRAALVLEGSADFGDGSDGALVVDGVNASASTDGQAHPWQLAAPSGVAVLLSGTSGGALSAGTHAYRVTAVNAVGETTSSNVNITITAGQNVRVVWLARTCALAYRVYRDGGRIAELAATNPTELIDDGSVAPGVAPPVTNTTENAFVFAEARQVTQAAIVNCALVRAAPLVALSVPVALAASAVPSSGTVPAGTYFYTVRPVDPSGVETRSGPQGSIFLPQAGNAVDLTWDAVLGAAQYRVYRRPSSSGSYTSPALVCTTMGTSCRDAATTPAAGAPCADCNATRGGRVAIRSLGTIAIDGTSRIDVSGQGYAGGGPAVEVVSGCEWDGTQGSSYRGTPTYATTGRYGGGGAGYYEECSWWIEGGGGGGHGTAGQTTPPYQSVAHAGVAYGSADLIYPTLGSGGGSADALGGAGGGSIDLAAHQLIVDGELRANGRDGGVVSGAVPGGAGAGGSIRLRGAGVTITGAVRAVGGIGVYMDVCMEGNCSPGYQDPAEGGDGGGGRVAIYSPAGGTSVTGVIDRGSGALQGSFYQGSLGASFVTQGSFVSAVHDTGGPIVQAGALSFSGARPPTTAIRIQLASSADGVSFSPYLGPDCTTATFYETATEPLCATVVGDRYLRLRVELESLDGLATPVLDAVTVNTVLIAPSALLVSSPFDTGDTTGKLASVGWTGTTPGGTLIELQVRSAADVGGVPGAFGPWLGPTGSDESASWYTDPSGAELTNPLQRDGLGDRWLQYRVRLTRSGAEAPDLLQVQLAYDATSRGDVDLVIDGNGAGVVALYGSGGGGLSTQTADASTPVTYVVAVHNAGETPETYALTWSIPLGFTVTLDGFASPHNVLVDAGASTSHNLLVVSPPTAAGTVDIIVNARAQSDASKADSLTARLTLTGKEPAGMVSPVSPTDGAAPVVLDADLCWAQPSGSLPLTYEAQLALDSAFTQGVQSWGSPAVDFIGDCVQPALQAATPYFWRVRADNTFFGPGPWPLAAWQFETGHPPVAVTARYPWDQMDATPLILSLRWDAGAGGPGSEPSCYEVGYGSDDDEAKSSATLSPLCGTAMIIGPLDYVSPYRWCVRPFNQFGSGPWSCFGFVTDVVDLPGPPSWLAPVAGASGVKLLPRLQWQAGAGVLPDCFEVGVGADDTAAQQVAVRECSASLVWQEPLVAVSPQQACVRGLRSIWPGDWSCVTFTTGAVPLAPVLSFPADATVGVLTPVTRLGWLASAGAVPALEYVVRIWEPQNAAGTLREVRTLNRFVDLPVQPSITYAWQVAGQNDIGAGQPSAAWSFTTESAAGRLQAVARIDPLQGTERLTQFTFDASQSGTLPSAPIVSYAWETGDGGPPVMAVSFDYVYPAAGGYQARLVVKDSTAATSEVRVPVRVLTADGRVPPTVRAAASATLGPAPLAVQLSAASSDGSGHVATLAWTLGDGTTAAGHLVDHIYTRPGTYLARVTAIDDQGLSANDFIVISVSSATAEPLPPVVRAFVRPPAVKVGEEIWPECIAFDPEDSGAALTYVWQMEGATAEGATPGPLLASTPGLIEAVCAVTSARTSLSASDTVIIEVRTADGILPPRIATLPDQGEVCVGEAFTYNKQARPAARGTPPLLWRVGKAVGSSLVNAPAGFGVDPTTGIVEWRPTQEQVGSVDVAIRVENSAGTDTQTFAVVVRDCSPPPASVGQGCACNSQGVGNASGLLVLTLILSRLRRRRT